MEIRLIGHGTRAYDQMVALRMELLRRPLGLSFTEEQLAKEKDDILVGAFEKDTIIGCCVLTGYNAETIQLRQMAVQQDIQHKGTGRHIIAFAEKTAREKGYTIMIMHAREVALGFYQKCGYTARGEQFTEVGIPHYYMEKRLL
jgi:GNAT superfamily N-acetyltransferase